MLDNYLNLPKSIHDIFINQCNQHPNHIAVRIDSIFITYSQLLSMSLNTAHWLKQLHNIKRGDIIIQCIDRSIEMVIGMLAISMVGGVYCPIHSDDPIDRIQLIKKNLNSRLILTSKDHVDKLKSIPNDIYIIDTNTSCKNYDLNEYDMEDIAYIIHTSGSTGNPKAIMISRNALFYNLSSISSQPFYCDMSGEVIQFSRCTFDVHISDIFGTLFYGGTIVMLNPLLYNDPSYFVDVVRKYNIKYIDIVPSIVSNLVEAVRDNPLTSVIHVSVGGESTTEKQFQQIQLLCPNVQRISNSYGPAECTITSLVKTTFIQAKSLHCTNLGKQNSIFIENNIGQPLQNYSCHILDEDLNHSSQGELYIGGKCLLTSYADRTQNGVIIEHPEYGRLYRTGDIVKKHSNGDIIFIGRQDYQIKLRGQRIECAEIEQILIKYGKIQSCIVSKYQEQLICYVLGNSIILQSLKQLCHDYLPQFMIPFYWVFLDKWPLSVNGKIDRKALPPPVIEMMELIKPCSDIEQFVYDIVSGMFPQREISMNDDIFLTLGMNSIQIMSLLTLLRKQFNYITIADLFRSTTLKEISQIRLEGDTFMSNIQKREWKSMNLNKSVVSPAMNGMFMDMMIRAQDMQIYKADWDFEIFDGQYYFTKDSISYVLNKLLERHSILRSRIYFDQNNVWQEIQDHTTTSCEEFYADNKQHLEMLFQNKAKQLIDITNPPLLRITLYHTSTTKILAFMTSHIVYDHGCDPIYLDEMSYFISKYWNEDSSKDIQPLSIQYIDYSFIQEQLFHEDFMMEGYSFWCKQVENIDPFTYPVQTDRTLTNKRSGLAGRLYFEIENSRIEGLRQTCKTTTHNILLSFFMILLYKLNEMEAISISCLHENRYLSQTKLLIGYFMNTLPFVSYFTDNMTVQDFVFNSTKQFTDSIKYSIIPLQHILERLKIQNQELNVLAPFTSTIFTEIPSMFQDENIKIHNSISRLGGFTDKITAEFDFTMYIYKCSNHIFGNLEYLKDLYDETTITTFLERFQHIVSDSQQYISNISILLQHEYKIIESLQITDYDFGDITTIHESILKNNSSKDAVILDDQCLTFSQLIDRCLSIASYLQTQYNISEEDVIIQCLERSLEMVVGMIAIILSGCIYCPIHPDEPLERIHSLISNTSCKIILSVKEYKNMLMSNISHEVQLVIIDELNNLSKNQLVINNDPNLTAYMITTSGSTGNPKIMKIQHSALFNYTMALTQYPYNWDINQRCLQTCRCSFDVHIMDIYSTLMLGSTVIMLNRNGLFDMLYFNKTIHKQNVTIITLVPSLVQPIFKSFLKEQWVSIQKIVLSGEALTSTHVNMIKQINNDATIINFYGPAECTVNTSGYVVNENGNYHVPIGKPLTNYECYILNAKLQHVPIGIIGELYVGGKGLLKEYIDKQQTEKNIIYHPSFGRIYKTGDLVKVRFDGNIVYMGRSDFQVKIRGQRLEIGEIESVIMKHPQVKEVVIVKHNIEQQDHLVSYIMSDYEINQQDLIDICKKYLRTYMIPSIWMILKEFPLNSNNKVDRKRLPIPKIDNTSYVSPQTDIEYFIVDCIKTICQRDQISMLDDLFSTLHMNSLQIINLLTQLNQHPYISSITISDLFQYTQIQTISNMINKNNTSNLTYKVIPQYKTEGTISSAQQRIFLDELIRFQNVDQCDMYHIFLKINLNHYFNTIQRSIEEIREIIHKSLYDIIKRHQSLRSYIIEQNDSLFQKVISMDECDIRIFIDDDCMMYDIDVRSSKQALLYCQYNSTTGIVKITFHHIAFDGFSQDIFLKEFAVIIKSYVDNTSSSLNVLSQLNYQYLDYCFFEKDFLHSDEIKDALQWWIKNLESSVSYVSDLPLDFSRTLHRTGKGRTITSRFSSLEIESIKKWRSITRTTTNMTLHLILYILFMKLCNQNEIVLGGVHVNRYAQYSDTLIGMFVNTLVYKFSSKDCSESSLKIVSNYIREKSLEIMKRSYVPFDKILYELHVSKNVGTHPLFQVLSYSILEEDIHVPNQGELYISSTDDVCKFDLEFCMFMSEDNSGLALQYSNDIFSSCTAITLMNRFKTVATTFFNYEDISLIDIILPCEYALFNQFAQVSQPNGKEKCVHDMIIEMAVDNPNKTSVSLDNRFLTYQQLVEKANAVASSLQDIYNIHSGDVVVLIIERSIEMIVGMVGIIMAGGVYCPIHRDEPNERIKTMIQNVNGKLIISTKTLLNKLLTAFDAKMIYLLDHDMLYSNKTLTHFHGRNSVNQLCYIIHTSGSTGKPKAIQISHKSLYLHFQSITTSPSYYNLEGNVLQMTRCTFDPHIVEIYGTLSRGGTCVVLNNNHNNDLKYILSTIHSKNITSIDIVPSLISGLLEESQVFDRSLDSVYHVTVSGEDCNLRHFEQLQMIFPKLKKISNTYGPAECTIAATTKTYEVDSLKDSFISIGKPLSNYSCYILDKHMNYVPSGMIGELYIGGECLMIGYADPTLDGFVHHPVFGKLYKTGDLVKIKSQEIVFIGRSDYQIKIR